MRPSGQVPALLLLPLPDLGHLAACYQNHSGYCCADEQRSGATKSLAMVSNIPAARPAAAVIVRAKSPALPGEHEKDSPGAQYCGQEQLHRIRELHRVIATDRRTEDPLLLGGVSTYSGRSHAPEMLPGSWPCRTPPGGQPGGQSGTADREVGRIAASAVSLCDTEVSRSCPVGHIT